MTSAREYVQHGEAAFEQFRAAIEGFDAGKWEQVPAEGAWSMKQLLSHFAANTQGHVVEIDAILNGGDGFHRESAPWIDGRDAALAAGYDATVAWMRQNHDEHIDRLRALTDDDLAKSGQTGHGSQTVERLLAHFGHHGEIHAGQAREIRESVGG